ncbi:hypothetical protein FO519_005524 [Halicephalobus sp. NKZ332]|nr:hypothetical protein FO519_005524 [Halicephalobus sp. NKZ332]
MHGRKSLRVTDEIPLNDVSKDKDKEVFPNVKLSIDPKVEEIFIENQGGISDEKKNDINNVKEESESIRKEVLVKTNMGLINSKRYDNIVPATQDQEEYEMVVEEGTSSGSEKLQNLECIDGKETKVVEKETPKSGRSRKLEDFDETKRKLFDLYGNTTPAELSEKVAESKEKSIPEDETPTTSEKTSDLKDVTDSRNSTSVGNTTPTSSKKKQIFEELKSACASDEPILKKRRVGRIQRKSVVRLPLPDLPEDFPTVLQTFGLKGFNKCNDNKLGNMKISGRDFNCLRGSQFLNDTVIDKYLELVCKRSTERQEYRKTAAVSCFFPICLNRGNMRNCLAFFPKDTFDYELLLIPANEDSHWYLFVADFVNLTLFCYDSLDVTSSKKTKRKQILEALKILAENEKREINWDDWSDFPTAEQVGPMQDNGYDCGVYVLQYADRISRNVDPNMCDTQMQNYRKRMIYELLQGELLPPSPY